MNNNFLFDLSQAIQSNAQHHCLALLSRAPIYWHSLDHIKSQVRYSDYNLQIALMALVMKNEITQRVENAKVYYRMNT